MSDHEMLIALLMRRYAIDGESIPQRDAEDLIGLMDGLANVNGWEVS